MKRYMIYSILFGLLYTLGSCDKFLDIDAPKNQLMADDAFKDDKTATATIVGIYSSMNGFNYQFGMLTSFMTAMSADDFFYRAASFNDFRNNSLGASSPYLIQLWSMPYAYIYQANLAMRGIEESKMITENVKKQLLGEAHFMRAFSYFYLVNLFGDVPLVLDNDVNKNTLLPRNSASEVSQFVIDELIIAMDLLDSDYSGAGRVRPNKQAAMTLLARAYLYQKKYSDAEKYSSEVILDPKYKLEEDLKNTFLTTSQEAIWQLQTVNISTAGVNTWEGFNIVPFADGTRSIYELTVPMVNAFEVGDLRKRDWLGFFKTVDAGGADINYYYPKKYRYRTTSPVKEYNTVLRFAELYLIRAEARANQGKLDVAVDDINIVRVRAGLEKLSNSLGKPEVLLAIENERRVELFTEWGHRWFDLKRTGRALEVLSPLKTNLKSPGLLYPIPKDAIDTNPNLKQNDI